MRRIPGFFLFNIIIPCLVVTSFSVFTFAFPPEFGERVTLVIEAFLTISIVILNVAGSIPVTSDASPIIVKLLLANMFQIGFALIANCQLCFFKYVQEDRDAAVGSSVVSPLPCENALYRHWLSQSRCEENQTSRCQGKK